MKSIKFVHLTLIAGLFATVSSCKKYLDINKNPNTASTASANLLLPTSQLYIGNAIGDRMYEQLSVWSQYYTGGPGVSLGDWDKNTMATSDANQLFINLYRSMSNLNYIIKNSGQPYYSAAAKVLMAYSTQVSADLLGNIPYSEALKGSFEDGFVNAPVYDNAQDVVYPGVEDTLVSAIATLSDINLTYQLPGSDDLIYPGEGDYEGWTAHWRKFANSLLLKLYLRSGNEAAFKALYESGAELITTNDDNAFIAYEGAAKSKNPWWTDANSTSLGNYFAASKTTIDYLKATSDPRIDKFFDPPSSGVQTGLKQGDVENSPSSAEYSTPNGALIEDANGNLIGDTIFSPTAPVILMSAWEVNFILAEAAARGWISADAKEFYDAGVVENSAYLGVDELAVETYLAGPGKYSPANAIKSIARQKWVSFNGLQPIESWIETRRLDSPSNAIFASPGGLFVVPTNNVLGGNTFPSILYYPATEQDLNSSFPGQHALTDKVFWDN
jgi:hypothetical protein